MKDKIKYLFIGVLIVLLLFIPIFKSGIFHTTERITNIQTDTIYIDKPYKVIEIRKEVIEKPVKVYVYKTDTVFRKRIEKDTLISAIKIERKKALVHTLSPLGVPVIKEYKITAYKSFAIDYKGNIQIKPYRRSRRKKTIKTIGIVTVFVTGIIIGNHLK